MGGYIGSFRGEPMLDHARGLVQGSHGGSWVVSTSTMNRLLLVMSFLGYLHPY